MILLAKGAGKGGSRHRFWGKGGYVPSAQSVSRGMPFKSDYAGGQALQILICSSAALLPTCWLIWVSQWLNWNRGEGEEETTKQNQSKRSYSVSSTSSSLSYARVSLSLELFVGGSEFYKRAWPVRRADPARGIPCRYVPT